MPCSILILDQAKSVAARSSASAYSECFGQARSTTPKPPEFDTESVYVA